MTYQYIERAVVSISMLQCGDDFERRLAKKSVKDLADSVDQVGGFIHPPVVRASDMQVIAGEDRVASRIIRGHEEVTVDLVECSDEEVALMREHENVFRRNVPPADVKAMVEQLETMTADEQGAPALAELFGDGPSEDTKAEKRPRGRPKTARGKAIDATAEQLGTSTNAVRKKLQRAKDDIVAPFEAWGRDVDHKLIDGAARSYRAITLLCNRISGVMVELTTAQKGASLPDVVANEEYEALRATMMRLRGSRPVALCPWCKGDTKLLRQCAACNSTALLQESLLDSVPKTLRNPAVAMSGGKEVGLADTQGW